MQDPESWRVYRYLIFRECRPLAFSWTTSDGISPHRKRCLETGTKGPPRSARLADPHSGCEFFRARVFYCSTGGMVYRSEDDGLQWQMLAVQWNSKATAEHATGMAMVEGG